MASLTIALMILVSMFSQLTVSATTSDEPDDRISESFESRNARSTKSWQKPIIMEMLSKDSYFPHHPRSKLKKDLDPTTPSPSPPTPKSSDREDFSDATEGQASSISSAWTPMPRSPVTGPAAAYGQPVYFPAPSVYGYPVNNYSPPAIKSSEPVANPVAVGPLLEAQAKPEALIYNVPVKSIEYVAPVKTEYAPTSENLATYNSIRKPDTTKEVDTASSYGSPALSYNFLGGGAPATGHTANGVYAAPVGAEGYGVPAAGAYGAPAAGAYGAPPAGAYGVPASGYGAPTAVKKNVHNIHEKILHRYNHHQKILHEHNLHRYIVHNYHLHRFHVHNYNVEKEHIHQYKNHVHNKYEHKETEEHKTKESEGEAHKHVTEVKETYRQAPPIYQPMHVVKPQWPFWG